LKTLRSFKLLFW